MGSPIVRDDAQKSNVREIPLTNGMFAIVDDFNFARLSKFTWSCRRTPTNKSPYAQTSIGRRSVQMHQLVLPPTIGKIIDHRNGDGLDNRRANLRLTDYKGNARNARWSKAGCASKYKGVIRRDTRWQARLRTKDGSINLHLGMYDTEEDAALAYDRAARIHYGEFACTNFHEDDGRVLAEPRTCDVARQSKPIFSLDQVVDILRRRRAGETQQGVADLFGVSDTTIWKVETGQRYRLLVEQARSILENANAHD